MLFFHNWNIRPSPDMLNRSYEYDARKIQVTGDMPSGMTWSCAVRMGKDIEIYPLTYIDGRYVAEPSEKLLNYEGWYELQLTAVDGSSVYKTNIARAWAPETLRHL